MKKNQYYIYLFRVNKTNEVIYVGMTSSIGPRINEHRRGLRDELRRSPVHRYMISEGLDLFRDVTVELVDFIPSGSREEAYELEALYFDRYKETLRNFRRANDRTESNSTHSVVIINEDTGEEFPSIRKASEHYGLCRAGLAKSLREGTRYKGFKFKCSEPRERIGVGSKKVTCVETGQTFKSIKSCAEHFGFSHTTMTAHLAKSSEYRRCGLTFVTCND